MWTETEMDKKLYRTVTGQEIKKTGKSRRGTWRKKRERMKELTELLTKAGKAYYQESREIMSNFEYDRLYDELQKLEEETGIVLAGSPTRQVGYEVLEELPKERHEQPMLSLDKTKEVEVLKDFVGAHKVLLSWKMDGLTVVLTYREGTLFKAVTRGNGEIGEVSQTMPEFLKNVPLTIPYKGELVLRGEAVISYKDFEKINERDCRCGCKIQKSAKSVQWVCASAEQ